MKRNTSTASTAVLLLLLYAPPHWGLRDSSARGENRPRPAGLQSRHVPGRLLIRFHSVVPSEHADVAVRGVNGRRVKEIPRAGVWVIELPAGTDEAATARALSSHPDVEFAELDRILPAAEMIPNDPLFGSPNSWALTKIKGPAAWATNTGNSNVIIAILDTGVDGNHVELAGKMVPGWNVYNNNSETGDVTGHGTMVAGTAAASSNNGIGVASVAWECRVMPVRISDELGYATDSSIASGLTWAADHGARVANISYNVTGSSTISRAARSFKGRGGVVVTAAGNEGTFYQSADDPAALTVGATDSQDVAYSWSNRGNNIDLVAPGSVYTTARGGGYAGGGGTSLASPLVAGAAALLLSSNPGLTPAQVYDTLKRSADDLGEPGWDTIHGSGRLNLERALNMTPSPGGGADTAPPVVAVTSPVEGATVSGTVNVQVSASDDVSVSKVELYADGYLQGTSSAAPYAFKWNTRRVAAGAHTLQSKAYDSAGNVGVSPPITIYK